MDEMTYMQISVAPFTGAWIEMPETPTRPDCPTCRSLHGSVD